MKTFLRIILFVWQIPQCLVGLIYLLWYFLKGSPMTTDADIVQGEFFNSVSLGELVFVRFDAGENTRKHELGHRKQSRMLGPLYLFVVGLPSLCLNILFRIGILKRSDYFTHFPENWADRLGGVER